MAILRVKDDNGNVIDIPAIKGDTPVKGVDYWTEADKAEINNYINGLNVPHLHIFSGGNVPVGNEDGFNVGDIALFTETGYQKAVIKVNEYSDFGIGDYRCLERFAFLSDINELKDYVNQQLGVIENGTY